MLNNDYGLAEIHAQLLETLDAFDAICKKHGVYYSLHGGTLLGAVRNGKLIPWDDDIDITITRDYFNKFKRVMSDPANVPEGFYIDQETMWFPRFVMEKQNEPVYIDLLVWDYVSSSRVAQIIKVTMLRALQGALKEQINYERQNIVGKTLLFVTSTAGKLFPRKTKLKMYEHICTKWFQGDKKCIHRANDSYRGVSFMLDSDYMNDYMTIELEGRSYYVNKRHKEFLVMEYGENYLTPPPESERRPGHEQFRDAIKQKQSEI